MMNIQTLLDSISQAPGERPVAIPLEDWERTPPSARAYIAALSQTTQELLATVVKLEKRVQQLETKLNMNSSNSNRPPSTDSPFKKKQTADKKGKPGGRMGHKGHRQVMREPTETKPVAPEQCPCGSCELVDLSPYYTHQYLELPEIKLEVLHFVLHRGKCCRCGKVNKAVIPREYRAGYGPRLSATIAELSGTQGDSRTIVQDFCSSVLGVSISLGAIQKVIDRASTAIQPHYEEIADEARTAEVNHLDETSFAKKGLTQWLWVMANSVVAFFMIHARRSKEGFKELVKDWEGILISDGYGVYCHWVGLRQTCLAHLIRKARELSEKQDPQTARFGKWALAELQRLCHLAREQPTIGQWRAFYARLLRLIALHRDRPDDAGKFARRLHKEIDALWLFLVKQGVSPTNNHAERMLRYAILWRKRSQGTASEKSDRGMERILSLRQTCRLRSKPTFPVLVEAIDSLFQGKRSDLSWLRCH